MPTGRVKWYDATKGFGFVTSDEGGDVFLPKGALPAGVTDLNRVLCVALNGSGRVIKATTAASVVGVICTGSAKAVGDPIDVMTAGEIVELAAADLQTGSPAAGTKYFFDATASRLSATAPGAGVNGAVIGTTVEAGRLVVRVGSFQG